MTTNGCLFVSGHYGGGGGFKVLMHRQTNTLAQDASRDRGFLFFVMMCFLMLYILIQ